MKNVYLLLSLISVVLLTNCTEEYESTVTFQDVNGKIKIIDNNTLNRNEQNNYSFIFQKNDNSQILKFEAIQNEKSLISKMFLKRNETWMPISELKINTLKNSQKIMNSAVIDLANSLKKRFDKEQIVSIVSIIENIPKLLYDKLDNEDYYQNDNLAIFYHTGAFKSVWRSYENNSENCQCGIYESSLDGKSPFFCAEDKPVRAEVAFEFIENISTTKRYFGKKFTPRKTYDYLDNFSGEIISLSTVDIILRNEFKEFWLEDLSESERASLISARNERKVSSSNLNSISRENINKLRPWDPECYLYGADQGGDCGCCNNYSGPCYFCHLGCYMHDQACEDCGWGCGPTCVSGPC
jgi:hypothetical protein